MADREILETDVLWIGAGPAGLGGAIRLAQLAKAAGGLEPDALVRPCASSGGPNGKIALTISQLPWKAAQCSGVALCWPRASTGRPAFSMARTTRVSLLRAACAT